MKHPGQSAYGVLVRPTVTVTDLTSQPRGGPEYGVLIAISDLDCELEIWLTPAAARRIANGLMREADRARPSHL